MIESLARAFEAYASGRYEEALEAAREDGTGDGEAEAAYLKGLCAARLGRWNESIEALERVVTGHPDFGRAFQCRFALAYAYAESGRFVLAEFELETLVRAGFESPALFAARGHVAVTLGKYEQAVDSYDRALSIDPDSPNSLNGHAYACYRAGTGLKRALLNARKALDANPDYAPYLDTMACVCDALGMKAEAVAAIRKARSTAPENEEIAAHLKEILEATE